MVVDRLTKMAYFISTTEKTTAGELAQLFRDNVWKLNGLPENIISDRGLQFAAGVMRELNAMLGIDNKLSTAFYPQTDGQTERMNQKLEQYLRMFIDHQQEQWLEWLGTAEFTYNNKVYTGTKVSPFKANNGQDPRMGFELRKKGKFEEANKFVKRMQKIQGKAKAALVKTQENMKKYADRHKGEAKEYRVGDIPSFPLTTTMVKSNIPNKPFAFRAYSPDPQAIPPSVSESPDSLNLFSHSSSRASKHVHHRGCLRKCCIIRRSSGSISAAEDSRKTSPEPFSSSSSKESDEDNGPKTPTASRTTKGKLSSYKITSLQFPATPSFFAPQGSTQAMSWDDQVAAEESRGLVSGVVSTPQAPLSTSLMSHGSNHGTAESGSQLGGGSAEPGTCNIIGDSDIPITSDSNNLHHMSQSVTSNIVTPDVTHDYDL